ncbi:MmgE/PrpD family protein [Pacificoceanicola onchidii]|uniref:MmgE/PrpD family protein n=1 Tax=Pacificoceanicola onchidii TaxID=2562685 RepID=UPI0010A55561|nr:MmgE/PrpD family protein [Pacificoceanicola onchidii]
MSQPIARRFAAFAARPPAFPAEVTHAGQRAVLDTLGAMIAGGAHPGTKRVAAAMPRHAGPCPLVTGGRSDAETAASINGMAAHVWDIDDTSYTGIMHGSAVILPAVLAVAAEIGAEPDQILRAFVVGSEITYVLADLCTHDHYFAGWWSTVTFGLTGATAAMGVLLGLSEVQMASAIGMAAAATGGGKAVFGSDAKPFLVGDAARRAITFARMASTGLRGPEQAFEDARGFLKLLNGGKADLSALETLGQRWRLVDPGLLFKTNPVCSAAHAAIDQMNALMTSLACRAEDIAAIRADVPELVFISLVFPDPQTPQEAQFSLPYALACVALHGRVRFEDLLPEALHDPAKRALMDKVQVAQAADLSTGEMRERYPESARLTLTLSDGRSASGFCGSARGMPDNPQGDDALVAKFSAALDYAGRQRSAPVSVSVNPLALFADIMGSAP